MEREGEGEGERTKVQEKLKVRGGGEDEMGVAPRWGLERGRGQGIAVEIGGEDGGLGRGGGEVTKYQIPDTRYLRRCE